RGAQQGGLQALEVHVEVARHCRQNVLVATGGGDLERIHRCRTLVHLNRLAFLHAEGGTVHALCVDRDVAVDDEMTDRRGGASEAGTQHEAVETRFEELDHGLTGQTGKTAGFLVDLEHLSLTDAVLRAQTLLLLEADRVVAVVATAGASVLAWG